MSPLVLLLALAGIHPYEPKPDTLSISIIGDVMMHTEQIECTRRVNAADGKETFDFHPFLDSLSADFQHSDLAVANMEFSLGGRPYTGYPSFSAPESYADYVAETGINVFLTANNHIMDRGPKGLKKTREKYRQMGVTYTRDNPTYVEVNGFKVAIINCSYGSNHALSAGNEEWESFPLMKNREQIAQAVSRAHSDSADVVIAFPHWGEEYVLHHNASQRSFAEFLVECRVDAIVGAHPHVVQDFELIGGVPVYYSVGNAVSNMSAANTQLELMVKLRFVRSTRHSGIVQQPDRAVRLLDYAHEYLWCSRPGYFCRSFCTLKVEKMIGHRDLWINPCEYDKMIATYKRVTGILNMDGKTL